jgi:hypothetical protein
MIKAINGILASSRGANNSAGYLIKDTVDSAAHTGTTANTLIKSYLIPANTFSSGDWFQQFTFTEKVGVAGSNSIRTYFNTSASLAGATLVTTLTNPAANISWRLARWNSIKSATETILFGPTGSASARDSAANSTYLVSNIDWTIDQYFIVAFQLTNAADTAYLKGLYLIKT